MKDFTFIDLFAGIGGFHLAFQGLGGECVFACEIDSHARKTYLSNHSLSEKLFASDINEIDINDIPDHDVLCAGFPCQPFSQAGFKKGFDDTRGTLFNNIYEIIKKKKPKGIFLENVRHLFKHDEGRTYSIIEEKIKSLGYTFEPFIVKASDFNLPQFRPRLFMLGTKNKKKITPPKSKKLRLTMTKVLGGECPRDIGFTLRVGGRGSGLHDRRNWDTYLVDGQPYRIGPDEGKMMQGFPKKFKLPVSITQAMKQLGNSVAVPAIRAYGKSLLEVI